jgi:polyisoprenyl-teichoic acid--peptidoglycan teichoic acid transferase
MQDQPSVDFLKEKYPFAPKRVHPRKKKTRLKWAGALFGVVLISALALSYSLARETEYDSADSTSFSFLSSFRGLITSGERELTGEEDDRINILLLGNGGTGHDGPELTDTIIFASLRPSTNEVGLLSIPRDLIVPIPGYGYHKVNHANAYGEIDEAGTGPAFASEVISDLLDQEIHYYAKVDFDGFEELIDAVDGIDLYVDNAFSDYTYPTSDDLVQTIAFSEGWQHMDGETALQYSRSRHGTNGEGSDFARAERQQNVILAAKDELLSASVLLSPGKLNQLVDLFQAHVETDLSFWEMVKLGRLAPEIDNVNQLVLDTSTESPLYSSTINGSYVILPKGDDWSDVQYLAENIFTTSSLSATVASETPGALELDTSVRLEIQNGTSMTGLAFDTSQLLSSSGFDVITVGNADTRSYTKTLIYDLTNGEKSQALAILKQFFEADVAMSTSGWVYADEVVPRELTIGTPGEEYITSSESIDFLIILGEDAQFVVR